MAQLSLQALQADGFYMPADYDPKKHGSIDKFVGSKGSFGARANKLHLGILVVRFEMPHNVWCLGCGEHVSKGIRFNAEKKRVGKYYSTPIYEFRMSCRFCQHPFVVRTDPENNDFSFESGLKRKAEGASKGVEEAAARPGEAEREELRGDVLYSLESAIQDKRRAEETKSSLEAAMELAEEEGEEGPYERNRLARQVAREDRRRAAAAEQEADSLGLASASLLPRRRKRDMKEARGVDFLGDAPESKRRRAMSAAYATALHAPVLPPSLPSSTRNKKQESGQTGTGESSGARPGHAVTSGVTSAGPPAPSSQGQGHGHAASNACSGPRPRSDPSSSPSPSPSSSSSCMKPNGPSGASTAQGAPATRGAELSGSQIQASGGAAAGGSQSADRGSSASRESQRGVLVVSRGNSSSAARQTTRAVPPVDGSGRLRLAALEARGVRLSRFQLAGGKAKQRGVMSSGVKLVRRKRKNA